MMAARFHRDGFVTFDGNEVVGKWSRQFNGKQDRGVKLGDWIGELRNGLKSPLFSTKKGLKAWFSNQHPKEAKD